jgi:hypothetical protein
MKSMYQLFILFILLFFANVLLLSFLDEEAYEFRFFTIDSCILGKQCDREYQLKNNKDLLNYLSANINYEFENVTVEVINSYQLAFYFETETDFSLETFEPFIDMHEDLNYYLNEYYRNLNGRFMTHLEDRDLVAYVFVDFHNDVKFVRKESDYYRLLFPVTDIEVETILNQDGEMLRELYDTIDYWLITSYFFYEDELDYDFNNDYYFHYVRKFEVSYELGILYVDLRDFINYEEFNEDDFIDRINQIFPNYTIDIRIR